MTDIVTDVAMKEVNVVDDVVTDIDDADDVLTDVAMKEVDSKIP